jgi:hypothetical protein
LAETYQTESTRRATARASVRNVNGDTAGDGCVDTVDRGDFASMRGAKPATATRPINLARKLFRDGSWLTVSVEGLKSPPKKAA